MLFVKVSRLIKSGFINFKTKIVDMKNKIIVLLGILGFIVLGIAAGRPTGSNHENLKVLPKDISNSDLDSVMAGFEKALNVGCDFCHAKSKTNPSEPDFASDDNPEKEVTRMMLKMTETINKDYFNYAIQYKANELMAVSCKTCHDGYPRPGLRFEKKDQ